jgi:histone acetyltransferase (RNA polymerase elongator complex component)
MEVGIHLMPGLPGDSRDLFLWTIDRVIRLKPDFVRIHPTLVLRGAGLENLWKRGEFRPLSMDETILWLKEARLLLEKASIPIARIGLQADRTLETYILAGPYHPALRQRVDSAIAWDMAVHLLRSHPNSREATFICHSSEASNLRGHRNRNVSDLKKRFHLKEIFIQESGDVMRGSLALVTNKGCVSINRKNQSFAMGKDDFSRPIRKFSLDS